MIQNTAIVIMKATPSCKMKFLSSQIVFKTHHHLSSQNMVVTFTNKCSSIFVSDTALKPKITSFHPNFRNVQKNHLNSFVKSSQHFLCPRNLWVPFGQNNRFYHEDNSRQRKDDFTEEELKVLKELEEEEQTWNLTEKDTSDSKSEEEALLKDVKVSINNSKGDANLPNLKESVSEVFIPFEDQQRVIQDVIEEMWNPLPEIEEPEYNYPEEFFRRGKAGVFDLPELIELIKNENGTEIVVISLPKEIDYADHMVIVTAIGPKHLLALATYVRKRFKIKNLKRSDVIPPIIAKNGKQGWIALDLGNIILHIFLEEQRDHYDLEMLWTVGPIFDDLCNEKDPEIIQLLNMMK